MVRKSIQSLLLSLLFLPLMLSAQDGDQQTRSRWMVEIRKYKFELFTKELNLNKEQQTLFFPLYEEMEQAVYKINKESDELMKKTAAATDISDTEYEAAALAIAKSKQKEGEIELEYFNRFEKILTKKQLFQLKLAEEKFSRNIIKYHRKGNRQ